MTEDYYIIDEERFTQFKDSLVNMKVCLYDIIAYSELLCSCSTIPMNTLSSIIKETDSDKDKKIYDTSYNILKKSEQAQKAFIKTSELIDKLVKQIDERYRIYVNK